jgi:hypothetical protein
MNQEVSSNMGNIKSKSTTKNRTFLLNNSSKIIVENMENSSDLLNLNYFHNKVVEDDLKSIYPKSFGKSKNFQIKSSTLTWIPYNKNTACKSQNEKYVKNNLTVMSKPSASNLRGIKLSTMKTPVYRRYSKNKLDPEMIKMTNITKGEQVIMNYNVCQILIKTLCFCCQSNKGKMKQRLYERGFKKIINDMDVLNYIRKMHEIDILKYLLLNKKQISLFNFISKPSVSLVSKNQLIDSFQEKFDVKFNKDDIDTLDKNFHEIINIENHSRFDKKLLKVVASEIDNLIMDV